MKKNLLLSKLIVAMLCIPMAAQALPWYQEVYAMMPSTFMYLPSLTEIGSVVRDKVSSVFTHPASGWVVAGATAIIGLYSYNKVAKKMGSLRMELDSAKNLNKKYEANLKNIEASYKNNLSIYRLVIDQQKALLEGQELLKRNAATKDKEYQTLLATMELNIAKQNGNSPRETNLKIN